jgi:hypothetical protein
MAKKKYFNQVAVYAIVAALAFVAIAQHVHAQSDGCTTDIQGNVSCTYCYQDYYTGSDDCETYNFPAQNNIDCGASPSGSSADSSLQCGGAKAIYTMSLGCAEVGSQHETYGGQPITVEAGQQCAVGSGVGTSAGDYNGSTPFPSDMASPPGWTYSTSAPQGTTLPSGEFTDPANPYLNDRFFGGTVDVELLNYDDGVTLQVGSNNWTNVRGSCLGGFPTNPSSGQCQGQPPASYTGQPGDQLGFADMNTSVANGQGEWGSGNVNLTMTVTQCYSKNYLDEIGGYTDAVDYHPTADGVCTPATPTLNAGWQAGGSNQTITLTPGQTSVNVPFTYTDNGQANSKVINVICSTQRTSGSLPPTAGINTTCIPGTVQN